MSSRLSPLSASYVPHALCYIKSKRCACSNCTEISKKEAFMFVIDPDTCTACDSCMDACPCDAISIVDGVHTIDPDLCVDCGACMDVCEFGSIGPIPAMAPGKGAIPKPAPRRRSHCHPSGLSSNFAPDQAPATTGHSARSQLLRNSARSQCLRLSADRAQRPLPAVPARTTPTIS